MSHLVFENIEVLQENEHFIAFNKPAGLSFHSVEGQEGFVQKAKRHLDNGDLCPVHRLDKDTSGILLLAKGPESARLISDNFQNRNVEKHYLALSDKKPKKKQGSVLGDMERTRNGSWKLARSKENPAETQFFSSGLGDGNRVFIVKINTGKTHQIRVALKSLGAPILGDKRYGGTSADRMYLHAWRLGIHINNTRFDIVNPPSEGVNFNSEYFKSFSESFSLDSLEWPKSRLCQRES